MVLDLIRMIAFGDGPSAMGSLTENKSKGAQVAANAITDPLALSMLAQMKASLISRYRKGGAEPVIRYSEATGTDGQSGGTDGQSGYTLSLEVPQEGNHALVTLPAEELCRVLEDGFSAMGIYNAGLQLNNQKGVFVPHKLLAMQIPYLMSYEGNSSSGRRFIRAVVADQTVTPSSREALLEQLANRCGDYYLHFTAVDEFLNPLGELHDTYDRSKVRGYTLKVSSANNEKTVPPGQVRDAIGRAMRGLGMDLRTTSNMSLDSVQLFGDEVWISTSVIDAIEKKRDEVTSIQDHASRSIRRQLLVRGMLCDGVTDNLSRFVSSFSSELSANRGRG